MASSLPERFSMGRWRLVLVGLLITLGSVGCIPTVQMAAPKEPITVNLNVKIEHEIYVKVDKEVDALFEEEGLF